MYLAGDFSSDAQFFVFTGVLSFLSTMAILVVYVFFSEMYSSETKKAPTMVSFTNLVMMSEFLKKKKVHWRRHFNLEFQDFCFTVIVAVFWLSASAAWANGVINMKYAANPDDWLFTSKSSICYLTPKNTYASTAVKKCEVVFRGAFQKANVSIVSHKLFLSK